MIEPLLVPATWIHLLIEIFSWSAKPINAPTRAGALTPPPPWKTPSASWVLIASNLPTQGMVSRSQPMLLLTAIEGKLSEALRVAGEGVLAKGTPARTGRRTSSDAVGWVPS